MMYFPSYVSPRESKLTFQFRLKKRDSHSFGQLRFQFCRIPGGLSIRWLRRERETFVTNQCHYVDPRCLVSSKIKGLLTSRMEVADNRRSICCFNTTHFSPFLFLNITVLKTHAFSFEKKHCI